MNECGAAASWGRLPPLFSFVVCAGCLMSKFDLPDYLPPPPPNPDDGTGGRGRPPKLTEAFIQSTSTLLIQGNFRCVVAERLGVSPRTFEKWMRRGLADVEQFPNSLYVRFRAVVLASEREFECQSVAAIQAAGRSDPAHLEWLLERKFPQRWGRYRGELGELKRRIRELERLLGDTGLVPLIDAAGESAGEATD